MSNFNEIRQREVEAILDEMTKIIERPDSVLKNYKKDFYEIDHSIVNNHHTPGQEYVWLVRENGTNLAPVGINPTVCGFLEAALDIHSEKYNEAYHVTNTGLKRISFAKARDFINKKSLRIERAGQGRSCIYKNDEQKKPLFVIQSKRIHDDNEVNKVDITVTSYLTLTAKDIFALNTLIELGKPSDLQISNSFFLSIQSLTINGQELDDILDGYKENESKAVRMR